MSATTTLPTPITSSLTELAALWGQSQHQLIVLAAELADSHEWVIAGSPTPAHHLAAIADIEPCTAREWLRVGKRVRGLPRIAHAFADGSLSYSKVRAIVTVATPENEAELAALALDTPAGLLRAELARWLGRNGDPEKIEELHQRERSVKWRTEANGMVTFTIRLPPHLAAVLIAVLTTMVMRARPRPDASAGWPTLAQQHADAFVSLIDEGTGVVETEVVFHVRGDGCTADDGTPIPETIMARLVPEAFVRALIYEAEGLPVNASGRQRHPTTRQKRVVKARDRTCVDCGRDVLLEYDHVPAYEETGRTVVEELELRCAPCHHRRHD
ncbi:MAG: DUF222 domain-containing protein [Acidimicrobiales bacterium]